MAENTTTDMSLRQVEARMRSVEEEITRLRDADEERGGLDDTDDQYFEDLCGEHEELVRAFKQKKREERAEQVQGAVRNPKARIHGSYPNDQEPSPQDIQARDSVVERRFRDPWDLSEVRNSLTPAQRVAEFRSRALGAAERLPFVDDGRKEVVTKLIERNDTRDGRLARQLLATSSEDYVRAFAAAISANGELARLSDDDRRALVEARGVTLTDAEGGFLVPFQLDPSVINTSDGSFNQVRQLARKVVATGDVWNGVSSAGVSSAWTAEEAEAGDDAPSFTQPSIAVHKLAIFVPISIEAAQDAANVANEIAAMIAFEKDVQESTAFVTGSGTGQPTGIVTALDGVAGSEIDGGTLAGPIATDDVYSLDNGLPLRYNFRAAWLANKVTYNAIKKLATDDSMWGTTEAGTPGQLLGHPTSFGEAMDDAPEVALTAGAGDQNPLVLGDWNNYVVADRIGTTVEFIPHLFHTTTNRPSGQRGWYAYARVGADSVNDGAFRMLRYSA